MSLRLPLLFLTFLLLSVVSVSAALRITEFMATNDSVLDDENGDFSDWIEIYNDGTAAESLLDWALTDNAGNPNKWKFPAVTLPAKAYLVVFASGKDRRTPGQNLHTNFKLSGDGEYLALVRPDGTKATEFAPYYPPQLADVSYGGSAQKTVTNLLQPGSSGKVLVPADGSLGTTWTQPGFADAAWTSAVNGIGFEVSGQNEFGTGLVGDVLSDDPTGYFRLEESGIMGVYAANAGSVGAAGNGSYLNGIVQNVATLQSPAYPGFETDNQGARFDGTNDKVDVPYNAALNGSAYSFSLWVKVTSSTNAHRSPLTSRDDFPQRGYIVYAVPNGSGDRWEFVHGTGGGWSNLAGPAIQYNTWTHIAGTYAGGAGAGVKKLYINGAPYATATGQTFSPNTARPLRIGGGATEGGGNYWFPGEVDEVAVWNRQLSDAEVQAQYDAAVSGDAVTDGSASILDQTPSGYWRLKDPATAPTFTAVNQGSAGTAANATWNGAGTLGNPGPRPASYQGFPADNKCATLTGTGHAQTPYHAALNPSIFTVECWAKATGGTGTYRAAVSARNDDGTKTYGYIFYAASNNTWQFWTGSGGTGVWDPIAGPAVVLGQWVHLVGTYDGVTKRFFVNGSQVGTGVLSTFNPNTARGLRIGAGRNEVAADYLFQGEIDEVAIHPRALTAAEISARYQSGLNNTWTPQFTGLINSDLQAAMFNTNSTAYFRLPFSLPDPGSVDRLTLKVKYDDGFQAYLNGAATVGGNQPPVLDWNSAASARSTTEDALVYESFDLTPHLGSLQTGSNVLAIHGLNLAAGNPDFLNVVQLEATDVGTYTAESVYLPVPSPGDVNGLGTANPGPALTSETLSPSPAQPTVNDDLHITVRAAPVFDPVASVTLHWRVNYAALQQTAMFDDGAHGDGAAGDGVYGATILKTNFAAGNMVRWYFVAEDTAARTSRWPLFLSPTGSREYFGTMIADTGFATALPVWYWFTQNTAAAATRGGTRGSVYFGGELHDNIFVRLRGGATSSGSKKFDFNSGDHCYINTLVGRVEEANLNGTSLSSGIAGDSADATLIRPAVAYEVFKTASHTATGECFPIMMRVNGLLDSGSGRGGIAYYVEQVDERYLRRHQLDDEGALYKMDQRSGLNPVFWDTATGVEKKTRQAEDFSDLQAFVNGIRNAADGYNYPSAGPNPAAPNNPPAFLASRTTYLYDNANIANLVNYLACRAIIGDSDDTRKNFYMYRDTNDSREWHVLPWDKDGTFGISLDDTYYTHPFKGDYARRKSPGANANNQWNYLWEAVYNDPAFRDRYLRRLRSLMDTILQPTPGGYLESRADYFWAPVAPHKPSASPAAIKTWLNTRRGELFTTYSAANSLGTGLQIPTAQPANALVNFGAYDAIPTSGNQEEEYIEIANPNAFVVDISGWKLAGGVDHTFQGGTVLLPGTSLFTAGRAYAFRSRAVSPKGGENRFVQGNFAGTISARGETITLVDPVDPANPNDDRLVATLATAVMPTAAQTQLRITELNYNPSAGGAYQAGEYEFIELKNIGATPLNLEGANFTHGITYTFGAVVLSPGAHVVVAKNPAAFAARYGAGLPVVGPFAGSLDNAGERLRIVDAVGEEVLDFSYQPTWQPTADGAGGTLVIADETADYDTWGQASSWQPSADKLGSPGTADPAIPTLLVPGAFVISAVPAGNRINLTAIPGRTYFLDRSVDLLGWQEVATLVPAANGAAEYVDPESAQRYFYRVRTE